MSGAVDSDVESRRDGGRECDMMNHFRECEFEIGEGSARELVWGR